MNNGFNYRLDKEAIEEIIQRMSNCIQNTSLINKEKSDTTSTSKNIAKNAFERMRQELIKSASPFLYFFSNSIK